MIKGVKKMNIINIDSVKEEADINSSNSRFQKLGSKSKCKKISQVNGIYELSNAYSVYLQLYYLLRVFRSQ